MTIMQIRYTFPNKKIAYQINLFDMKIRNWKAKRETREKKQVGN